MFRHYWNANLIFTEVILKYLLIVAQSQLSIFNGYNLKFLFYEYVLFYLIIAQLQVTWVASNFCYYKLCFDAYLITYALPPMFPVAWLGLGRANI